MVHKIVVKFRRELKSDEYLFCCSLIRKIRAGVSVTDYKKIQRDCAIVGRLNLSIVGEKLQGFELGLDHTQRRHV
jgi:hypothetical protein